MSDYFAQFPDYISQVKAVDQGNFAVINYQGNNVFQTAFFYLGVLQFASTRLRSFTAIDSTYIKSRYRMILLITYRINSNRNIVLLA